LIVPLTSTAMIRVFVHDPARGVQQPSFTVVGAESSVRIIIDASLATFRVPVPL
jgi:hypothetical protein